MSASTARRLASAPAKTPDVDFAGTIRTGASTGHPYDEWILLSVLMLLGIGVVMVYSASVGVADMRFGDPERFLRGHLVHVGVGVLALIAGMWVNHQHLKRFAYWILAASVLLLLATVVGFGINRGHSTRWLGTGGFEFQPSEIAKLALVIYLAYSLEKKLTRMSSFLIGLLPHLLVCGLLVALCLAQPDLGTCLVLGVVMFAMLWVAGSRSSYVLFGFFISVPIIAQYIAGSSGRLARIMAWLNPWDDRYGAGFQTANALMSLASGGVSGLGLGAGRQKMGFLTQGWTDFIFSSIGEELGLVGTATVLLLFAVLVWRGLRAARRAPDPFGRFLAFGITVLVGVQATFNMGVSVGLVPTKGLNLPLVSGGGSSLAITCFALGILLNVSRYAESPQAWRPLVRRPSIRSERRPRVESPGARRKKPRKKRKAITQRDSGVIPFVAPTKGGR